MQCTCPLTTGLCTASNLSIFLVHFKFIHPCHVTVRALDISLLSVWFYYTPAPKEEGYTVLPFSVSQSVCNKNLSVSLSLTKISVAFFSATIQCRCLKFKHIYFSTNQKWQSQLSVKCQLCLLCLFISEWGVLLVSTGLQILCLFM